MMLPSRPPRWRTLAPPPPPLRRGRATVVVLRPLIALATLSTVALGGCRAYEPAPLDLTAHGDTVTARPGRSAELRAFAARLTAVDPASPLATDSAPGAPAATTDFDLDDGLDRREGEVLALFFNPDLRLARASLGVAEADAATAGLWSDPEFGFDGAEVLSGSAPFEFGLTLGITIPLSGRLEVARDRARAGRDAAERELVAAEWAIRTEVRRRWATWSLAAARADLIDDLSAEIGEIGAIAGRLAEAGELSRAEARIFAIELAERSAARAVARAGAERARLDVLAVLGLSPAAAIELRPDRTGPDALEARDALDALDHVGHDHGATGAPAVAADAARLIASSPRLDALRAAYHEAEESLRLEVRKQYPDLTIGGGYGSEGNDDRLLLGLSIPVPIFNRNQAGIAEAEARRTVARIAAETTFDRLLVAVTRARADHAAAREHRRAFTDTILPLLKTQARELDRLAELGEVDTPLLLETLTRRVDARLALLDVTENELHAAIAVLELLGPNRRLAPAPVAAPADHSTTPTDAPATPAPEGDTP